MTVTYHRLVQRDIDEICRHYDDKSEGLGDAFFAEFESVIQGIRQNPGRWPFVKEGTEKRKGRFKRFPYVVVYRQVSHDWVRILIVKHKKRRDSLGARRA